MIKKIHATLEDFENYIRYDKKTHKCELLSFIQNPKISKTYFNKLSIFDKNTGTVPEDKAKIEEILKILKKPKKERNKEDTDKLNEMLNLEEKMGIGIMYGMAIGDAIGAVNEFEDVQYPHKGQENILEDINSEPGGHFMLKPGQWTDDTSMGLCIADSLIVNNGKALDPYDLMNRFVAWWRGGYNNAFRYDSKDRCSVGLGGNISMALFSYIDKPIDKTKQGDRNTSGNGSIMRNAAIPICFHKNLKEAQKNARIQSLTTHQGDEAKECCSLLTFIIIKIFERKMDKKEINNFEDGVILRDILTKIGKDFETEVNSVRLLANSQQDEKDDWNWKNEKFEYNPERQKKNPGYIGSYAMDNMAMSLHILYYTNSFKDAILRAANLRGDSDSVASVVGQIAGAYYPLESIPHNWISAVYQWDHGEIALRGYMLSRMANENANKKGNENENGNENKNLSRYN